MWTPRTCVWVWCATVLGACTGSGASPATVASQVLGAAAERASDGGDPLLVHTEDGWITGVAQPGQRAWLGVPYAAPPVGPLRWRPPQPAAPWDDIRETATFGPRCLQRRPDSGGHLHDVGSEDCLTLNVYVPDDAGADAHLPVMVYLFPGGNSGGDNRQDMSALVHRGVIAVVPNYRLGVLGWFGHPALTSEGGGTSPNYGLYDQMAALAWVRDNIAAFGGDPGRVTLFGASAGSTDTVALLATPAADGLYQQAIAESGYHLFFRLADSQLFGSAVAARAGCGDDQPDVAACLRALPFDALDDAFGVVQWDNWSAFSFDPVVDGLTVADEPGTWVATHGTVPLMTGYVRDEMKVFLLFGWGLAPPMDLQDYANAFYTYTPGGWYPMPSEDTFVRSLALYPVEGQIEPTPEAPLYPTFFDAFTGFMTDAIHGCPGRRLALESAVHDPANPVYRYVMTHTIEDTNWQYGDLYAFLGGFHMEQDVFLFDFKNYWAPEYHPTEGEQLLADQMGDYWTNFAKSGDPNGPGLPTWPRFEPDTQTHMVLDDPVSTADRFHTDQCEFVDPLDDEYVPMPPENVGDDPQPWPCGIYDDCPTDGYLPQ